MKIGVLREGKVPPDQRVPLTPAQCADLKALYPEVELVVESSGVRRIQDEEYRALGVEVVSDMSDCDVLLGVKEVPVDELIADKTYLFFSHTYKLQPYNAKLLRAIVDKRIRLIDYELIKRTNGSRGHRVWPVGWHCRCLQRIASLGDATRDVLLTQSHRL